MLHSASLPMFAHGHRMQVSQTLLDGS